MIYLIRAHKNILSIRNRNKQKEKPPNLVPVNSYLPNYLHRYLCNHNKQRNFAHYFDRIKTKFVVCVVYDVFFSAFLHKRMFSCFFTIYFLLNEQFSYEITSYKIKEQYSADELSQNKKKICFPIQSSSSYIHRTLSKILSHKTQ